MDLDLDLGMLAFDEIIYIFWNSKTILLICSGFNRVGGLRSGSRSWAISLEVLRVKLGITSREFKKKQN